MGNPYNLGGINSHLIFLRLVFLLISNNYVRDGSTSSYFLIAMIFHVGSQTIDPLSYLSLALMVQNFTLLPMVFAMMTLVKSTTMPTFEAVISLPTLIDKTRIHACFLRIIDLVGFNSKMFSHSYT